MKNNFKPSKGQSSKKTKSTGQKFKGFDRSSQPLKYGNFDKKKNSYRREDGNGYFPDRNNRDDRDNNNREKAGYRGGDNNGYKRGGGKKQGRGETGRYSENSPKKFSRESYGGKNGFNTFGKNYSGKKPRFENGGADRKDRYERFDRDRNVRIEKTGKNARYAPQGAKAEFDGPYIKNIHEDVFENGRDTGSLTFGRNAVIELLKSDKTIDKLFVQSNQREGSITMIVAEAVRKSIPVVEVEKQKLDKMIEGTSHQGVVAMTSEIEYCSVDDILDVAEERNEKPFILIADKIMDAQNLGAIIRTAECAGVHGVIIPKRHASGVSSVVGKVSAGALFHIKIAKVANIASTIEDLKERGVWTFASTSDSVDGKYTDAVAETEISDTDNGKEIKNYCEADYDLPLCLAVGNEGDGLSPIILQKSDFLINIPMYGKIESLNVSCAAAVLLYEIARQRKAKKQTD